MRAAFLREILEEWPFSFRRLSVKPSRRHHKLPLSEGGTHDRSNLIALRMSCHGAIHAKRGDYWENRRGQGRVKSLQDMLIGSVAGVTRA